jgi:hypothetical protein
MAHIRTIMSYVLAIVLAICVVRPVMTELIEASEKSFANVSASTTDNTTTAYPKKKGAKAEQIIVVKEISSTPIVLAYGIRIGSLVLIFCISVWAIVTIIRID